VKKLIRKFAVWLQALTDTWVVPKVAYEMLDQGRLDECEYLLRQREKDWPRDPEMTHFWLLLEFLRGRAE
jgi:hypothetical protein